MKHYISSIILSVLTLAATAACTAKDSTETAKEPTKPEPLSQNMQTAVLGAGCFWCVESYYEHLDGVHDAISGYAGGKEDNPTYKQVSAGHTTHAEVVKVIYDPSIISYSELVDFFWTTHDATRGDGVWPDFGAQYRSILLYQNETEEQAIEASLAKYESETGKKIATDIKALTTFYPAEDYHQDYAERNPTDRYVQGILNPKLKKLGFKK